MLNNFFRMFKKETPVLPSIEEYRLLCNRMSYLGGRDNIPHPVYKTDNIHFQNFTPEQELEWDKNYLERLKIYHDYTGKGELEIDLCETKIRIYKGEQ